MYNIDKLQGEWKKLEESFTENDPMASNVAPTAPVAPNAPYVPVVSIKGDSIKVLKVLDGDTEVDSERGEAPTGPSYSSGGTPGHEGYYIETKTVTVIIECEIVVEATQAPFVIDTEDKVEEVKFSLDTQNSDDLIFVVDNFVEGNQPIDELRGFKSTLDGWDIKPIGGNKVHISLTINCENDEPPEADVEPPDYDGDYDYNESSKRLYESKNKINKLLKDCKLLQESLGFKRFGDPNRPNSHIATDAHKLGACIQVLQLIKQDVESAKNNPEALSNLAGEIERRIGMLAEFQIYLK